MKGNNTILRYISILTYLLLAGSVLKLSRDAYNADLVKTALVLTILVGCTFVRLFLKKNFLQRGEVAISFNSIADGSAVDAGQIQNRGISTSNNSSVA